MLVLEYWAETLHEHGADEWAPRLKLQFKKRTPESFRELWQTIAMCVRQWIVRAK
jgi:hypothetical protein